MLGRLIRRLRYSQLRPVDLNWFLNHEPYAQEYLADWLVEDFVLPCEVRIMKRFAEMGIRFTIPLNLPEIHNPPRRPRSIW